jgi:hypothetical protein
MLTDLCGNLHLQNAAESKAEVSHHGRARPPASQSHIKKLIIYEVRSRKFTTENYLYQ